MKDMLIKILFLLSFVFLAIAAVLFYIHFGDSGNLLVVRLDSVRGINFISRAGEVWGVLAVALVINVINLLLAIGLMKRDRKLALLPLFAGSFVGLLILIYISVIITNN